MMDSEERPLALDSRQDALDRLLFRIWLAVVALFVVVSLLSWVLIVTSREYIYAHSTAQQATPRAAFPPPRSTQSPPVRETQGAPSVGSGFVWVNTRSKVYHYPGSRWYGRTAAGKYLTEGDALLEGDRAATNERRPDGFVSQVLQ